MNIDEYHTIGSELKNWIKVVECYMVFKYNKTYKKSTTAQQLSTIMI